MATLPAALRPPPKNSFGNGLCALGRVNWPKKSFNWVKVMPAATMSWWSKRLEINSGSIHC